MDYCFIAIYYLSNPTCVLYQTLPKWLLCRMWRELARNLYVIIRLAWIPYYIYSCCLVCKSIMVFAIGISIVKPYVSLILSAFAFWLALKFLDGGDFMLNEGGAMGYVSEFLIGYWLWLLSMGLNFVLNIILTVLYFKDKRALKSN